MREKSTNAILGDECDLELRRWRSVTCTRAVYDFLRLSSHVVLRLSLTKPRVVLTVLTSHFSLPFQGSFFKLKRKKVRRTRPETG